MHIKVSQSTTYKGKLVVLHGDEDFLTTVLEVKMSMAAYNFLIPSYANCGMLALILTSCEEHLFRYSHFVSNQFLSSFSLQMARRTEVQDHKL